MSPRTFQRRFKAATHETVIEYLQKIRMEAAKKLLEINKLQVGDVMFEVGYSDPKAFREIFRKITGVTPSVYKGKYELMIPEI
jgi:transcriptional regulator GlxA family with amidase domain